MFRFLPLLSLGVDLIRIACNATGYRTRLWWLWRVLTTSCQYRKPTRPQTRTKQALLLKQAPLLARSLLNQSQYWRKELQQFRWTTKDMVECLVCQLSVWFDHDFLVICVLVDMNVMCFQMLVECWKVQMMMWNPQGRVRGQQPCWTDTVTPERYHKALMNQWVVLAAPLSSRLESLFLVDQLTYTASWQRLWSSQDN